VGKEPKIVGRYALFSRLDSGGMATVYIGRALGAGGFASTVAIKRLHAHFAQNPEFSRMFLDEARIASRVRHPNVVPVLDVVALEDELFLVLELVIGHALSSLVGEGRARPPLPVAAALAYGALLGLHAAHTAKDELGNPLGLVHRDVSPQNVLVGRDGVPRVIDFGVAKALGRMTATREGELKGKLAYMAPEQLEGHATPLSDVFAGAVVLWELVTGERLFFRGTEAATILAVTRLEVPAASARVPEAERALVAPLDAVLSRALSRDPAARYPSALAFAEAIEAAVRPASALDVGRWVGSVGGAELDARAREVAEVEQMSMRLPMMEGTPPSTPYHSSRSRVSTAPAMTYPPPPLVPSFPLVASSGGEVPAPRDPTLPSLPPSAKVVPSPKRRGPSAFVLAMLAGLGGGLVVLGAVVLIVGKKGTKGPAPAPPIVVAPSASAAVVPAVVAPCPAGMGHVEGGELFMGTDDKTATPDERPAHPVKVSPYCLDLTEVTVAQYKECSDKGKCKRAPTDNEWDGITAVQHKVYDPVCTGGDDTRAAHPINCVDWEMASRYCREMREGGRLPTEAEWELAARGSDGRIYPWGDTPPTIELLNACDDDCVAWGRKHPDPSAPLSAMIRKKDGFATTAPVGSFPAGKTRFGMLDMAGNVWEWVSDFHASYTKTDVTALDPKGPPSGDDRVIRGGSWNGSDAAWLRPTFRYSAPPSMRSHGIGFRCAKAPAKGP